MKDIRDGTLRVTPTGINDLSVVIALPGIERWVDCIKTIRGHLKKSPHIALPGTDLNVCHKWTVKGMECTTEVVGRFKQGYFYPPSFVIANNQRSNKSMKIIQYVYDVYNQRPSVFWFVAACAVVLLAWVMAWLTIKNWTGYI